jgi:hypothetical protein
MRTALAGLFLLVCAGTVGAAMPSDPVEYIRAIYRAQVSQAYNKVPAWYDWAYSPRLRALIVADQKAAHGEVGRIDFDPIINAQDWELGDVTVTPVSRSPDRVVVDAEFLNFGYETQIRYDFVRVRGRWLIDEIQSLKGQRWTLSKILSGAPDAFPKD